MSTALRRAMSREEFLRWDGHLESRYEFDGEQPVAMTGGNLGHSLIVANLVRRLGNALSGTPCFATGPEAGIATVGARVRYPDAVISCTPFRPDDKLLPNPVVVFEVVSQGSGRIDRAVKPVEYAGVPSILRYVVIESRSIGAAVRARRRGSDAWEAVASLGAGDMLALPEIGVDLPLDDLYERVLP